MVRTATQNYKLKNDGRLLKYFAYGSNMHPLRLKARTPSCRAFGVAHLTSYKLCFHKRGQDGSGKCNAWFTGDPTDHIIGVVYTITRQDKPRLDQAEGLGRGYNETMLRLTIAGNKHTVFFYVADSSYIDNTLKPFTWYKALVMAGCHAHRLPDIYKMQQVARVEAVTDTDSARTHEHLKILTNSTD
jgi:hypothetical protein